MFIEEATSCGSSILMELEFGGVSFCQEGKPEKPEKNTRSKERATHMWHRVGI